MKKLFYLFTIWIMAFGYQIDVYACDTSETMECTISAKTITAKMAIAAEKKDFCPGGKCYDHYVIPVDPSHTGVDIWYKGVCIKIKNLSNEELVIPTRKFAFYKADSLLDTSNSDLGCTGDFISTRRPSPNKKCNRNNQIKIETCSNLKFKEFNTQECEPGCSYVKNHFATDDNVTTDASGSKTTISSIKTWTTNEYFGNGAACSRTRTFKYYFVGNVRYIENGQIKMSDGDFEMLRYQFDQPCNVPVPACCSNASSSSITTKWTCYTCGGGGDPQCTFISTDTPFDPDSESTVQAAHPVGSGGTTVTR